MKHLLMTIICLHIAFMSFGQDIYGQREARTEWFREARFGMFIHWGLYAIPARGEWVRNQEKLTLEDYQKFI